MKTKINIAKILISCTLLFFITACGNKKTQEVTTAQTQQHTNNQSINKPATSTKKLSSSKTKHPKKIKLTDDNVVAELTKYGKENPERLVRLTTTKGTMLIQLFEDTPLHRANFVHLIKENFYDGTEFYRVIDGFMIQGGDSDGYERYAAKEKIGKYTIPSEFRDNHIHRRDALSMVREYENNPEKRSSPYEFFIVQGTRYTDGELRGTEFNYNMKISPENCEIYKTEGGCAYLDGQHTVFGQVIEGMEVIDKIAAVKTDNGDWPIEAVKIKLEIVK